MSHTLRRLAFVPLSALVVSLAVFAGMHSKKGDPCLLERAVSPTYHGRCVHQLGLDRTLPEQYLGWLRATLSGVISPVLAGQAATSAGLGLWAIGFAIVVGLGLGCYCAANQNTWRDRVISAVTLVFMSTPNFVVGTVLVLFTVSGFYSWTGGQFYESIGWGRPEQVPVPAIALGLPAAALIARHVRGSLLDVMRLDYVTAARAKGLGERLILVRHALRNALIPVAGLLGSMTTTVITGSVVIEYIFGIPGLGKAMVGGLLSYNYLLPVTVMTYYAILIGVANSLSDLAYTLLDPRVRW